MDINSKRKYVVIFVFVLIGLIYLIRLFFLQVVDTQYKDFATNNVLRKDVLYPARGLIYDRNGELLVYNKAAYDLLAVPREIKPFDTLEFCNLLEISVEELRAELKRAIEYSRYKPSVIVKQISPEKYAVLQEQLFKVKGFYVQSRTLRQYPKPIAAHVLGYVSEASRSTIESDPYYKSGDYIGSSGIEKSYEKELRGKKGVKYYMVDVHNRFQGSFRNGEADTTAIIGRNLIASLDTRMQEYAELLLQNKRGSIVIIEPATGEVLVMANMPGYDPNLLVGRERGANYTALARDPLKPLFDRALMAEYPPGSTFKMANALIGLQEKVITPRTYFPCMYGYHVGNFTMGCHHDQSFDVVGSIAQSCNAYYAYEFRAILENPKYGDGKNTYDIKKAYNQWRDYLMNMGFGRRLDTDFAHEKQGLVPSEAYYERRVFKGSRWRALPIISLSIGQGELGITPLQLANYTAMIANRGYYYIPHIVRDVEGLGVDERFKKPVYVGIEREHFESVIQGMENVMKPGGTGYGSYVPGIAVCGKTGTVQNPHGLNHSVFMAFAPKDDPQIAISVYIENVGYGSQFAGPIASLMIEKYLNDSISADRKWLETRMLNTNLIEKNR